MKLMDQHYFENSTIEIIKSDQYTDLDIATVDWSVDDLVDCFAADFKSDFVSSAFALDFSNSVSLRFFFFGVVFV